MDEQEILVTEQVAENAEHTAEESPRTYTEAEFNAKLDEVLGKKLARRENKIRKEYERKYGNLEAVLRAGTGKESVDEITETFTQFYKGRGVEIPDKPTYSAKDIDVLARAEAEEIIRSGDDDVAEEVDRLARLGADKMNAREKAVFKVLAEHRQNTERRNELSKIGVAEDVYNSAEFKDFAKKFNANTPVKDIYDIYNKTIPKKEIKTMGSMKNTASTDSGVKEFYTVEEARRIPMSELYKNPALEAAIERSMLKW